MEITIADPLGIPAEELKERLDLLKSQVDQDINFKIYETKAQSETELIERCIASEIVIITNTKFTKRVINKLNKLKFISVAFTGVDHIDLEACRENDIEISNAAGYSTQSVAELTLGLIIALIRKFIVCDHATRSEKTRNGLVGTELQQKTVGIIGTGSIGLKVAELLNPFKCRLLGYNRTEKQKFLDLGGKYTDLPELMASSDIITIHLALTNETRNLIDKSLLQLMKPTAVLINCARGPIVDYDYLTELLNNSKIAGAALDVYDSEPPLDQDYPILNTKNTILLPHIGFATNEAFNKRADIVIENIRNWLQGIRINKIL